MQNTRRVAVIGGSRIPFVKSFTKYSQTNQDMLTATLNRVADIYNLDRVDEVVLGTITKSGTDWNLAREAVLGSKLSNQTPAFDIQRACGTSLEATMAIANKIALGQIECGIAGGSDSNTKVSLEFSRGASDKFIQLSRARNMGEMVSRISQFRPGDFKPVSPGVTEPRTGKSMGDHCELMAKEWGISREAQDQLALSPIKRELRLTKKVSTMT